LALGLRRAERHFRELTVPGIGGVSFVRQLSWAVAGLQLASSLPKVRPAIIANAVEALGCKLAYFKGKKKGERSDRLRGVRAFERDKDALQFRCLSKRRWYVQVTYRQGSVGPLVDLGLAEGSRRYNAMRLTDAGRSLAKELLFFQGKRKLGTELDEWIRSPDSTPRTSLWRYLGPDSPSQGERAVVKCRLTAANAYECLPSDRRLRLIEALEEAPLDFDQFMDVLRRRGEDGAANHLELARSFADLARACRMLIRHLLLIVGDCGQREVSIQTLLGRPEIGDACNELEKLANIFHKHERDNNLSHPDTTKLLREIDSDPTDRIANIVGRDQATLRIEGSSLCRGPRFDVGLRAARAYIGVVDKAEIQRDVSDEDPEDEDLTSSGLQLHRLEQLRNLWQDCIDAT